MEPRLRHPPPHVRQDLDDSCWAAVIESWSRADRGFRDQHQSALVRRWGEGPTGGITPTFKLPIISGALHLRWAGVEGRNVAVYLNDHLRRSYVFCGYRAGAYSHSMLIFAVYPDLDIVSVMDPNHNRNGFRQLSWFTQSTTGFAMMHR